WGPPESPAAVLFNADDEGSRRLSEPYRQRQAFTLGTPGPGEVGVADGWIVDRIGVGGRVLPTGELPLAGAHNVANALAAVGLVGQWGFTGAQVTDDAIAAGLRAFRPGHHRNELVATVGGVDYVDDSKATNPH